MFITFEDLYRLLNNSINEEAGYSIKDGGVIKVGFNEELDQIRNISSSNKTFLINLEQRERERTGIKTLKRNYPPAALEPTKRNCQAISA